MMRGVRLGGIGILLGSWMLATACRGSGERSDSPSARRLETEDEAARGRIRRQTPVAHIAPVPPPSGQPLVGPAGHDEDGYPKRYVDRAALRSLLSAKHYTELTRHFEDFQAAFEANPRNEYWPIDASDAFAIADPELLPQLDAWVAASPDSFAPYLARGACWAMTGFARRGTGWASETHVSNFDAMRDAHQKAMVDLEQALQLRPKLVAASRYEIKILEASSGDLPPAATVALKNCPECFQVRVALMFRLTPRWGGSYEEMLAVATDAPVAKNRRLRLLPGYVDYDRAEVLSLDEEYDQALAAIQRACALGEHWQFLQKRAELLDWLGDLDQAKRDIERAVELRPGHPDVLFDRARIALERKEYEAAGHDLMLGLRMDPTDSSGRHIFDAVVQGLVYQGWEQHKAGHKEEALRLLELATDLDPKNRDAQQRHAFLIAGAGVTAAQDPIDALKAKVQSAPDDFRAHQELDYTLAKQRRFPEVVEMWNQYLSRHPEDGRAHLERGGAFWNMGRREDALVDASKACELGVSEGCARTKQAR